VRSPLPPSLTTVRAAMESSSRRDPRTSIPYEDLIDVVVVTQHWHVGQGDPIYALTSSVMSGKNVPIGVAERAVANLERAAEEVSRARPPGWERDVQRLGMAISDLEYRIYEARERAKVLPNPRETTMNACGCAEGSIPKGIAGWQQQQDAVRDEVAKWSGKTFNLRGHSGTFRVSERASYWSDSYNTVLLYTERLDERGKWTDFAKGTPDQLEREAVNVRSDDKIFENPKPRKMIRGLRAIELAERGAPLFVFNQQRGWVPGGPGALARAQRIRDQKPVWGPPGHGLSDYGVPEGASQKNPLPLRWVDWGTDRGQRLWEARSSHGIYQIVTDGPSFVLYPPGASRRARRAGRVGKSKRTSRHRSLREAQLRAEYWEARIARAKRTEAGLENPIASKKLLVGVGIGTAAVLAYAIYQSSRALGSAVGTAVGGAVGGPAQPPSVGPATGALAQYNRFTNQDLLNLTAPNASGNASQLVYAQIVDGAGNAHTIQISGYMINSSGSVSAWYGTQLGEIGSSSQTVFDASNVAGYSTDGQTWSTAPPTSGPS